MARQKVSEDSNPLGITERVNPHTQDIDQLPLRGVLERVVVRLLSLGQPGRWLVCRTIGRQHWANW